MSRRFLARSIRELQGNSALQPSAQLLLPIRSSSRSRWLATTTATTPASDLTLQPPPIPQIQSSRPSIPRSQPLQSSVTSSIAEPSSTTTTTTISTAAAASSLTAPSPPTPPKPLSESLRTLLPLLRAQPSHYITIHIHGKAYLVTPGDSIRLPFLMPDVTPGDTLRLNRASVLGSRDFTLKAPAAVPNPRMGARSETYSYIDERLYECRAVVLGVETEPMRLKIKKKQRNRRVKTVRSKHKFTVLRVSELRVRSLEEVESEGGIEAAEA